MDGVWTPPDSRREGPESSRVRATSGVLPGVTEGADYSPGSSAVGGRRASAPPVLRPSRGRPCHLPHARPPYGFCPSRRRTRHSRQPRHSVSASQRHSVTADRQPGAFTGYAGKNSRKLGTKPTEPG
ncbi:hypothetical protein SBD_3248 [Streptomyces bottropensis ATCC 25435]|uniref:Uncharacterized protein n=1 Tax=Streptomyces bottropensis ATCC 25435 TaxID=1054862 RepID=M3FSI0_9ACTN|nr:hypothetical protein SBD_3248 [Streptomyces bottropensis ATCC 25435]